MNRLAGIVVAALGFLVAILGALKVVPGLTMPGVALIVLGGLIIGLSFISKPDTEGTERMSTANSLLNIFISPSEVFQNLKRHPRWLVAVIIMTVLSGVYSSLFLSRMTPERVANYTIDKTLEMPMVAGNDQARKSVEDGRKQAIEDLKSPVGRVGKLATGFLWYVIGFSVLSGIFMLFALVMGGKIKFWQAFSATVYAAFPISVIGFILNTLILFLKDPTDIHPLRGQQTLITDNLSFLVNAADNPVIFTMLSMFSLLGLYWVWMNATGLKNAGEKVTGSIAWTSSIAFYAVLALLAIASAWAFPGFVS